MKWIHFMIALLCYASATSFSAVRIGCSLYSPPYSVAYEMEGVKGFDIDLMSAICKRLKWQCQYIPMRFNKLFSALNEGKIDLAIGSAIITPERQQQLLFSIPYLPSYAYFIVMRYSPIKTIEDLTGKQVGALKHEEYVHFLNENFSNQMTIVPYKIFSDAVFDLKEDKIQAFLMDHLGALYLKHQYPDNVDIIYEKLQVGNGMGIVTMPGNKDKIRLINQALKDIIADGTFERIYNYNFQFFIPQPSEKK